jgi:hypothetical protein
MDKPGMPPAAGSSSNKPDTLHLPGHESAPTSSPAAVCHSTGAHFTGGAAVGIASLGSAGGLNQ